MYVRAAEALWEAGVTPRGLVHISGGGLLNLARLAADVSYELDALPPAPPVFALIAEAGQVPADTMYATFNMGTGFCVIVSPGRRAGGDGRAEERRRAACPGRLGHRAPRPVRVDPVRRDCSATATRFPAGGRPPR